MAELELPADVKVATQDEQERVFGEAVAELFGSADGMSRVGLHDVSGDEPVKQHAQCGQILLHRGRRKLALQFLDKRGDVKGLHAGEIADAAGR